MKKFLFASLLMLTALFAGARSEANVTTVLPTDLYVQGNIGAASLSVPVNAIRDAQVSAGADIAAGKLQHAHRAILAQGSATTVAAQTQVIHVVSGATATLRISEAGAVVPAVGTDTATIDIQKNGTTVLSSVITLTSSQSARQIVLGTISVPAGVTNDVYEVVITPVHSTGTLAKGVFVVLDVYEDPS